MRVLFSSLLFVTLLGGCASQAQQASQKTQNATVQATQPASVAPIIVFRKTPCFGTCPHYEASIYADGRVSYEGYKYAPVEGKRELKMPIATINNILVAAKAARFTELQENYAAGVSDLPSTVLILSPAGGPSKTVAVEGQAPVELRNLLSYVQKQLEESLGASAAR